MSTTSVKSPIKSALLALLSALEVTPATRRALFISCLHNVIHILARLNFLVRFVASGESNRWIFDFPSSFGRD